MHLPLRTAGGIVLPHHIGFGHGGFLALMTRAASQIVVEKALDGAREGAGIRSRDLERNKTTQWDGLLGAGPFEGAPSMGWSAGVDGSGE
mmetsp:Transcript_49939/g.106206  ORF Transcript_49939/g.106206 Transcript_49939/m.106206 type:complete len:90 (-) Transcript_49939:72-341(-)